MGLKNRNTTVNYVRIKQHTINESTLQDDGRERLSFFVGKDLSQPYSELEGRVTKLFYKDEDYQGQASRKLAIVLTDSDGESYQLGLNVESTSYSDFVKYLATVERPFGVISLVPKIDIQTINGKEIVRKNLLVSQDGKFAKAYFTKDNTNGLPAWHTAKVGNKVVTDKSDYLEFLEKFVNDKFISKLPKEEPQAAPTYNSGNSEPVVLDSDDDDLPF